METWPEFLKCIQEFEACQYEPDLSLPTADINLENLERQGFDKPEKDHAWTQKLNTKLRNRVTFNVHPTNPHVDIKPIGCCEFWIQKVDLVEHKPQKNPSKVSAATNHHTPQSLAAPSLELPEIYKVRVVCVYNTDGKCTGMMTPERLDILHNAFHKSKIAGLHDSITPAPSSFTSKLLGLFAQKTQLESKYKSKKIKDSYSRTLPPHMHLALQKWALVAQVKWPSP